MMEMAEMAETGETAEFAEMVDMFSESICHIVQSHPHAHISTEALPNGQHC